MIIRASFPCASRRAVLMRKLKSYSNGQFEIASETETNSDLPLSRRMTEVNRIFKSSPLIAIEVRRDERQFCPSGLEFSSCSPEIRGISKTFRLESGVLEFEINDK